MFHISFASWWKSGNDFLERFCSLSAVDTNTHLVSLTLLAGKLRHRNTQTKVVFPS